VVIPDQRLASSIRRRIAIVGAAAFALHGFSARAASTAGPRIAAIDWAAAETLIAVGITPIAIADLAGFRASFSHLPQMDHTVDLGSTWEPNYELLDRLKPDLIYLPSWSSLSRPQLEQIAPVRLCDIHGGGDDPMEKALRFADSVLADFPDISSAGALERLKGRWQQLVDKTTNDPPFFLLNLRSTNRFVNVYATGSLPGSALVHVGFQNAWQGPVNGFGFTSIGAERLLQAPEAAIVILNQNNRTAEMLSRLDRNVFWTSIPAVRNGKVRVSPPVSVFGGILSGVNFAEWLTDTFHKAT
jgi:iron complex transport system substrate-binding protein